jgi:CubicO group peptidase (beta-lactamase class C family)
MKAWRLWRAWCCRAELAWVGCLLVTVFSGPAAASATPRGGFDPQRVDRFPVPALAKIGFPGMTVVITHGAQVVYLRGFGSAGHGQPVTARTVRELLNQTSGMADAGFPAVACSQPVDAAGRVTSLHSAVLVSEPGHQFHYFDPNYQVLARMVELVTGLPFAAYLRQQVLTPLRMNDTLSVPTAAQGTQAAHSLAQGHILVFDVAVARAELNGLLTGSSGVISTAADMGRWLIA